MKESLKSLHDTFDIQNKSLEQVKRAIRLQDFGLAVRLVDVSIRQNQSVQEILRDIIWRLIDE